MDEKKIKEMAQAIFDYVDTKKTNRVYILGNKAHKKMRWLLHNTGVAEFLYKQGYRKQSETVREFVSKIDEEIQHRTIVNDYTPDFDEMQDIIYQTAKEYVVEI